MLLPITRFIGAPIMGLQTGTELARVTSPIIDPRDLTVVAFYVDGPRLDIHPGVLHTTDIREVSPIGLIVDSSERIMDTDGLVRLQEVLHFQFQLEKLPVVDERGRKYGRVETYIVDAKGFTIQQLQTEQSILRSLTSTGNLIHRSQIVSVTNKRIVIRSATIEDRVTAVGQKVQEFVNPFREGHHPQPESMSETSFRDQK